jgi:hypothetical protein
VSAVAVVYDAMGDRQKPEKPAVFRVTYRDTWETERSFTLQAPGLDAAKDAAAAWKGAAPIAIVSVIEVFRHDGLMHCVACGQEIEADEPPHPEDAPGFIEFPAGEFPPGGAP